MSGAPTGAYAADSRYFPRHAHYMTLWHVRRTGRAWACLAGEPPRDADWFGLLLKSDRGVLGLVSRMRCYDGRAEKIWENGVAGGRTLIEAIDCVEAAAELIASAAGVEPVRIELHGCSAGAIRKLTRAGLLARRADGGFDIETV